MGSEFGGVESRKREREEPFRLNFCFGYGIIRHKERLELGYTHESLSAKGTNLYEFHILRLFFLF